MLGIIKQIFLFAESEGWLDRNPTSGISMQKRAVSTFSEDGSKGYQPFSNSELEIIFSQARFQQKRLTGHDGVGLNHRFWAPLISLHSGIRMNEILQLEKKDICQKEGIHCFEITDRSHEDEAVDSMVKRLKNRS
jgi:site-specific recombinase XerD